ncbi:T9SS type B sorting domain-containing protein [Maribacter sp. ACAM166]|uniref:T9SS type B sorting domain-containing protein n=1 Tax=Maribacter sp. ACAM166 TaxID=2508996 RepID=UPI0010FDAFD3|nr:T9SS type B sorting domain-containing protein [Maribacter sp. ACAM166]TLP80392.1 T9SS type B sorting domain-containing protein [Maribacter sp. ACAM166]
MNQRTILLVLLIWLGIFSADSHAQECPTMTAPLNGDINVPVDNLISWTAVNGVIGYLISLGTTPGGGEIINRRSSGLNNFYQPEVGLPENTKIYVTIRLFLPDAPIKVCPLKIFTTVEVKDPPDCTSLVTPLNEEIEVRVDTNIKWNYAPGATNYRISIGYSPGNYNIIDDYETGNKLSFKPDQNLELNQFVYLRIIPFNENGEATNCSEEYFTTGEPTVRCNTNDFPTISILDKISLCTNSGGGILTTKDQARGYRWIKINTNGSEEVLSITRSLEYDEVGSYRLELYNAVSEFGANIECLVTKNFEIVYSEAPQIENVLISRDLNGLRLEIVATGIGEYEYSYESDIFGFQDSAIFTNVKPGERTVFVRDKLGCGLTQRLVEKKLSSKDFPSFFTPNGDGINDFWQLNNKISSSELNIEYLYIFDKYGNLLVQLDPKSEGWNGSFNGKQLPATDYWFRAISFSQKEVKGHFSLKR